MKYVVVLVVIACTIGLCFGLDKIFNKIFRGKIQHKSGMRVKANKRYATFGLILASLGVAALCSSHNSRVLILIAGIAMLLVGLGLVVYYLCFGIYYDDESFIYSSLFRKNLTYKYKDIVAQQLYYSGANVVIELHLFDKKTIQLQSSMDGVSTFMNKALEGWLKQNNKVVEDIPNYDPHQFRWFPSLQEE